MSSLAYLCDYGSNSEESDSEPIAGCQTIEPRQKLPAPNLSKVSVVPTEVHVDSPQLHNGRTRSFPHVRGNWATYVYVKYCGTESICELINKLQNIVLMKEDSLQKCDDFHISLSKTVVLKYHLISSFGSALQKALKDFESFDLAFGEVKIFCNEENSRTFIALEVDPFTYKHLLAITQTVDKVLTDFLLPPFYEKPSFHMSILWVNGNKKAELNCILDNLNEILIDNIAKFGKTVLVEKISCKSGHSKSKVYVNPNFNRHDAPNNWVSTNNTAMHVNPKFSHLLSNMHLNTSSRTKIYVNPNFIKPTNNITNNSLCSSTSTNEVLAPINRNKSNFESKIPDATIEKKPINKAYTQPLAPISKSRYCLVRKNTNKESPGGATLEHSKNTFKINKYKSVHWKEIKQRLESTPSNKIVFVQKPGDGIEKHFKSQKTDLGFLKSRENVNRYKLVNHNNVPVLNNMVTTKPYVITKVGTDLHKKAQRLNRCLIRTKKIRKGCLKKNNIPCPLFRKFGTCLRNNRGNCEFLHDKKHVSVCRKFIKGICHDRACLLSHDLTQEKMPTCYFYLQGACFKDSCPYLHVKLNENAKICPDFMKGYCAKGSECILRHVNVRIQNKKVLSQLNKYSSSNIKSGNAKYRVRDKIYGDIKEGVVQSQNNQSALVTEYRYYQDNKKDEGTNTNDMVCEIIKPLRCKLGTLPSFIQL